MLVIGGSPGFTGAVTLPLAPPTAWALMSVQVSRPASLNESLAARLREQMPLACPETQERTLSRTTFEAIHRAERADAIGVPGRRVARSPLPWRAGSSNT